MFHSLCVEVSRATPPEDAEPTGWYVRRIHSAAATIQHRERKARRKAARAARRRNRAI